MLNRVREGVPEEILSIMKNTTNSNIFRVSNFEIFVFCWKESVQLKLTELLPPVENNSANIIHDNKLEQGSQKKSKIQNIVVFYFILF